MPSSIGNNALYQQLTYIGTPLFEQQNFSANTTQATGMPVTVELFRIQKQTTNNASYVLPSIATGVAPGWIFVINDDPANTAVVFPFLSASLPEQMNGVNNASLSIPAGKSAMFLRAGYPPSVGGGGTANVPDWRSAVIP